MATIETHRLSGGPAGSETQRFSGVPALGVTQRVTLGTTSGGSYFAAKFFAAKHFAAVYFGADSTSESVGGTVTPRLSGTPASASEHRFSGLPVSTETRRI